MARKGEKMSEEYKEKISQGRKAFYANGGIHNWTGMKISTHAREIISRKAKGNKRGLGTKRTKETKQKMSLKMKGNKNGVTHGLSKTKEYQRRKGHASVLKTYGLTLSDYDALFKKQKGKCEICKKIPKKILGVDHCHTTGVVRGLLCGQCNMALGLMKDNVETLKVAIKYLRKYGK